MARSCPGQDARRWQSHTTNKALYGPLLAQNTLDTYEAVWTAHVKDRYDHHTLAEWVAEPQLFAKMTADMRERGVGNASQRKVLVVMSSVFRAAVDWKKVAVNPVLTARKPPGRRKRIPHPLAPMMVERIRLQMRRRETKDGSGARTIADACLVVLMAYVVTGQARLLRSHGPTSVHARSPSTRL